jgi:hypothetical protein
MAKRLIPFPSCSRFGGMRRVIPATDLLDGQSRKNAVKPLGQKYFVLKIP